MPLDKKVKLSGLFIVAFVLILIVLIFVLGLFPLTQQQQAYTLRTSQTNSFSLHIFQNDAPLRLYLLNDEQFPKTCAIYPYKNSGTILRAVFLKTLKSSEQAFFDKFSSEGAYGVACFDEDEKLEPRWGKVPIILIRDKSLHILQFEIVEDGKLQFAGFVNDTPNNKNTTNTENNTINLEVNKKYLFVVVNKDTNTWDFTIKIKEPLYSEYMLKGETLIKFYNSSPYWPAMQPDNVLILGPLSFEHKGEYPLALMDPFCKINCSKKTQITLSVK